MNKKLILAVLFVSLVFIASCVQVEVYQKLKRDGKMDMSITLKSTSPLVLSSLKQGIRPDPSITEKYTFSETSSSVTYNFTDIDPYKDKIFASDKANTTSMFDNKNNIMTKEFKFPYYYYSYTLNSTSKSTEPKLNTKITDDTLGIGQDIVNAGTESLIGNIIQVTYTIEVFGKITETNGNKVSDNVVVFNPSMTEENQVYYVKFKDFFLSNWLGG